MDVLVGFDFQIGSIVRLCILEVDVFSLDLYLVVILYLDFLAYDIAVAGDIWQEQKSPAISVDIRISEYDCFMIILFVGLCIEEIIPRQCAPSVYSGLIEIDDAQHHGYQP